MITILKDPDAPVVEIILDREGLRKFVSSLEMLSPPVDDIHWATKAWGGGELEGPGSDDTAAEGDFEVIQQITIRLLQGDWET